MLCFGSSFNFPTLVEKLFYWGIYCIGTVHRDQKYLAIMKEDKDMKRGDINCQYVNNMVVTVKWCDNYGMKMIGTCLEE